MLGIFLLTLSWWPTARLWSRYKRAGHTFAFTETTYPSQSARTTTEGKGRSNAVVIRTWRFGYNDTCSLSLSARIAWPIFAAL